MSRQEMVAYGKQEFRHYPLVTLDPLPDQTDIGDYYRRAARFEKCKCLVVVKTVYIQG